MVFPSATVPGGFPDWHRKYNDAVKEDLDKLYDPNMSPEDAADLMRRYSDFMRDLLNKACAK